MKNDKYSGTSFGMTSVNYSYSITKCAETETEGCQTYNSNIPFVEKSSKTCYNNTQEVLNMSFVGMCATNLGIVAFADGKFSCVNSICSYEDVFRKNQPKLFQNKNFILATYGFNMIDERQTIEDCINELLTDNIDWEEFVKRFSKKIKTDVTFNFIIGYKKTSGVYVYRFLKINSSGFECGEEHHKGWCYGGAQFYIDFFDKYISAINPYIDLETLSDKTKLIIENLVNIFDQFDTYNPVGNEITVKIFKH